MKREDFIEITEKHFKVCESIIQKEGDCYTVICRRCPFNNTNVTNGLSCVDNNYSERYIAKSSKLVDSCKDFLKLKEA